MSDLITFRSYLKRGWEWKGVVIVAKLRFAKKKIDCNPMGFDDAQFRKEGSGVVIARPNIALGIAIARHFEESIFSIN